MKKTLLTTFIAAAFASSVLAQGIVQFSASTAQGRPLRFTSQFDGSPTNNVPAGNPATIAGFGQLNITAYAASAGTALSLLPNGAPNFIPGTWFRAAEIDRLVAPSAGNVPTFGFTMDAALGAPATPVQFIIVGWTGAFTDFASALQDGTGLIGWSGSSRSGGALSWAQPTGTTTAPVVQVIGPTGFNGLVLAPIPEPGTIVLGGLGIAALLLFRRRK